MSKFQIITLVIFVLCAVGGVIAFATYRSSSSSNQLPAITVWGTYPAQTFNQYVSDINSVNSPALVVTYVEKNPSTFGTDFVKALALGQGPDAILITADTLLPEENKLVTIPYTALSERAFMDTYIQEAQIYLTTSGILAIPFTVDPLVMYWNRDTYNAAGFATYPRYWDEFTGLNEKLTVKDQNGNVRKSAVALGTFGNSVNARELLGTLIMQIGNPVTSLGADGIAVSTFKTTTTYSPIPAVQFFTQFADPANANYSWNRGLPSDKTSFLSGMLATYFGFASELSDIRAKNTNLNFDVAPLPQVRSGGKAATYGKMYGFSIVRASANANNAYQVISILASATNLAKLASKTYLPTVMNSLNQNATDPYLDNFNKAALVSKTWLDVDPSQSRTIFSNMVDSITSGRASVSQAIQNAGSEYDVVLRRAGE